MKTLITFILLSFSLTAFSGAEFDCFARKGRSGVEQVPAGRMSITALYVNFLSFDNRTRTHRFLVDEMITEYTRTGTWLKFQNLGASLEMSDGGPMKRVYLTSDRGVLAMKCFLN